MAQGRGPIAGCKVAILVDSGFEQVELTEPRRALDEAGARTTLVSPQVGRLRAWRFTDWGDDFPVDLTLDAARAHDFDALLLPGGVINPDRLRMQPVAVQLVRAFCDLGKPVLAICHGPWTLIEAGCVAGRRLTSWPSLRTDLLNAGADWVDQAVVVDGNLVTSRKPDDIPAFVRAAIDLLARRPAASPAAPEEPAPL